MVCVTCCYFPKLPQLLVWPEQSPEEVRVVTITPDYPSSRHTGLVSGLRKFTWYYGSTLCFTTPGDGPCSAPTLLQTHEDSKCQSHMQCTAENCIFQYPNRICTIYEDIFFYYCLTLNKVNSFLFQFRLVKLFLFSKSQYKILFSKLLVFT